MKVTQAELMEKMEMTANDRFARIATANPATLAKIDAVLEGTDGKPNGRDDDCRLVTYTEAAKRLNVSRPTVYRLTKAARLEIVPLNGVNRIRLKSVMDFANSATK